MVVGQPPCLSLARSSPHSTTPCVPEDVGLAWKHTDWRTGQGEVRRARKLVVQVGGRPHWQPSAVAFTACRCPSSFQFICTVANYDYAFSFDLFLDGTIALNVKVRVDGCEGRRTIGCNRSQPRKRAPLFPSQLTGVLSTGVLSHADAAAGGRKYGSAVGGDLYAPVHQVPLYD